MLSEAHHLNIEQKNEMSIHFSILKFIYYSIININYRFEKKKFSYASNVSFYL